MYAISPAGLVPAVLFFAAALPAASQPSLTARQVIERIRDHIGVPWNDETVDTFKEGDPDTPISGIAVTMMATYAVLEQAAAAGLNLVITHEPTYFAHLDEITPLAAVDDPVFRAKQALIEKHGLVVWRFHDHWHRRNPDGILEGMIEALDWGAYREADGEAVFRIPEKSLRDLAAYVRDRLDIRTLRVVGEADLAVSKAALAPGFTGFERHRDLLARDDVEVLVMGEAHEWETIAYAADAVSAGMKKALIVMGHTPSEQEGMRNAADWLRTFVSEVPVEFVPAEEPFWREDL